MTFLSLKVSLVSGEVVCSPSKRIGAFIFFKFLINELLDLDFTTYGSLESMLFTEEYL
jgi:hypothetical protein